MSELQVGRLTNFLRALLVLGRGGEKVLPEISDEIQPVLVVEPHLPEHLFLGGWRRYGCYSRQQAGGAFNTRLRFAPNIDNMLVIIEEICFSSQTGQRLQLYLSDINGVDLPDSAAPEQHTLDSRTSDGINNDIGHNFLTAALGDVATLGQRIFDHQLLASVPYYYTKPIVMLGSVATARRPCLDFRGATLNTLIELSMVYRMRPIERSER